MMFKSINVWERKNGYNISVYRCFQVIPDNKYYVQNQDFYHMDPNGKISKEDREYFEKQFLELIFDVEPEDRTYFSSLEEAIENFNKSPSED